MEIIRKSEISYEDFINNHLKPGIPLIFTNATKDWKGIGTFSMDWFRSNFGNRKTLFKDKEYTMTEVIDMVEKSTPENPSPYPLIFNVLNELPELFDYMNPLDFGYAKPNWLDSPFFKKGHWGYATDIFVGGKGVKFPYVHLDYYHLSSWITMLCGQKEFTVFPRGQDELLYPDPENNWKSKLDIFKPDYEKYPRFREATPITFILNPGETLYIPFGLWHSAHSLTPSISLAFDQLSTTNAPAFIKDVYKLKKKFGKPKAAATALYALLSCTICRVSDIFGIKRKLESDLVKIRDTN